LKSKHTTTMFSILLVEIYAAHLRVLEKKLQHNTAQSGAKVTVLTLVVSPAAKCRSLIVEVKYEICKNFGLILRTPEQRRRGKQTAQDRE